MPSEKSQKNKGFTLVELMVSLGLFAVVMTMSASAVLTILAANARSQSSSSVMTNLNIALESMTRDIRTGTTYTCNELTTCAESSSFSLVTQDGKDVTYALDGTTKSITKTVDAGDSISITATPEITITNLKFYGSGFLPCDTGCGDVDQPLVRIVVQGEAGVKDNLKTHFDIQTSVSQRALDVIQ